MIFDACRTHRSVNIIHNTLPMSRRFHPSLKNFSDLSRICTIISGNNFIQKIIFFTRICFGIPRSFVGMHNCQFLRPKQRVLLHAVQIGPGNRRMTFCRPGFIDHIRNSYTSLASRNHIRRCVVAVFVGGVRTALGLVVVTLPTLGFTELTLAAVV